MWTIWEIFSKLTMKIPERLPLKDYTYLNKPAA